MSSMKMWETVLEREMFSSGCRPRLKNARAYKVPTLDASQRSCALSME